MSKYFEPYNDEEEPIYPEDVAKIRYITENRFGKLKCTDRKLGELWRDFSEECYCAGFLNVDEYFVERFAKWLKEQED